MYACVFVDNGDVVNVSYSEVKEEVYDRVFRLANMNGFFSQTTYKEAMKIIREDHRVTPDDDSNKLIIVKKAWRA